MPIGQDENALHLLGDLTQTPANFLTDHFEVDFTGTADEQKVRRSSVALAYLKSNPKIAAIVNFANPTGDKNFFFSFQNGAWVLTEYAVESGLQIVMNKTRLGGKLKQDTSIDGDDTFKFEVLKAKNITLETTGGTAKSTLTLGTALSIPTRIKTESVATPTTFAELVIDADNNTEIGQKTTDKASGMKMSNAEQVLMYNNVFQLGVKGDGIYVSPLPQKTTETDVVFVDSAGKLSKGAAPTGNSTANFGMFYAKQIPFTDNQVIAIANIENAFRKTVSTVVLNGYYIAVFRCAQTDALKKSATVNYQITGQSAATMSVKHGVFVEFKYVNDVLTDVEVLTDGQIVDKINNGFGVKLEKKLQFTTGGQITVPFATSSFLGENHWTVLDGYYIGACQCIADKTAVGTLVQDNGVVAHDIFDGCRIAFEYRNGILVGIDKLNQPIASSSGTGVVNTIYHGLTNSAATDVLIRASKDTLTVDYDVSAKRFQIQTDGATMRSVQIITNDSVLDGYGDLRIQFAGDGVRFRGLDKTGNSSNIVFPIFPRPRVFNTTSGSNTNESDPYQWIQANVAVDSWYEIINGVIFVTYKFIGLAGYGKFYLFFDEF